MRIGIDIDNTITRTTKTIMRYADIFARQNRLNAEPNYNEYYIEDALGWPKHMVEQFMEQHLLNIYCEVEPKCRATEVLRELSERHSLVLITSRNRFFPGIEEATRDWLVRYGIPYDLLVMNATDNMHHFSKVQACMDNMVEVMIEDHHDLALELSHIMPVILFSYPYNQHIKSSNIKRVNNWNEVKLAIDQMSQY